MKKRNLLMFLAASALVLGVAPVAGHAIYNEVNPSVVRADSTNVTIVAGTNGSACKVNDKDGIKVGTSKAGGDLSITLPATAKSLTFYAAAWNGVSGLSLNITPSANVSSASIPLNSDSGISNNSPFTLSGNEEDFKHTINLTLTAETKLTFTSSAAKRFVMWNATYSTESGEVTPDPEPIEEPAVAEKTVTQLVSINANDTVAYKVTATVKEVTNSRYGNLVITDGTSDIVVYGASISSEGLVWDAIGGKYISSTNLADFESSGITAGYTITMKAIRDDHTSGGVTTKQLKGYVLSYEAPVVPPTEYEEPAKANATIGQLLNLTEQKKQIYRISGTVTSWANGKEDGTQYGNFNITDSNGDSIYVYGSTASATALTWNKATGEYSFENPKDFLTNSLTKDIDLDYTVEMEVIYLEYNGTKEAQGIIISATAPAEPVDPEGYVDDLNKINPYFSLAYKYTHNTVTENENESTYFQVTNENQLQAGDHILLVQEMNESLYISDNAPASSKIIAGNLDSLDIDAISAFDSNSFVLGGETGKWTLGVANSKWLGTSKGDLSPKDQGSETEFTVSFEENKALFKYDTRALFVSSNSSPVPFKGYAVSNFGSVGYASKAYIYAKHVSEEEKKPEYTDVDFRLRVATTDMDEFALTYDVEDYGVYIEQGSNKVTYSFAEAGVHYGTAKDGAHIQYYDVQLGNLFEHTERFASKFKICAYSVLNGQTKYSTLLKEKSVADLVKDYKEVEHEDGVTNLYNILVEKGIIA